MPKNSVPETGVTPISLQNLEFVVPESLLKVVSLMDRGTGLNFASPHSVANYGGKQTCISVDKDMTGNVVFSVKSGCFQILQNGLKCVIRDVTTTDIPVAAGGHLTGDSGGQQSVGLRASGSQFDVNKAVKKRRNALEMSMSPKRHCKNSCSNSAMSKKKTDTNDESNVEAGQAAPPPDFPRNLIIKSELASDDQLIAEKEPAPAKDANSKFISSNQESAPVVEQPDLDDRSLTTTASSVSCESSTSHKRQNPAASRADRSEELCVVAPESEPSTLQPTRVSARQAARAAARLKKVASSDADAAMTDSQKKTAKWTSCQQVKGKASTTGGCSDGTDMDEDGNPAKKKTWRSNYSREKNIECRLCKGRLKNYVVLYDHVHRLHAAHSEYASYREEIKNLRKVSCDVCQKVLSHPYELKNHLENVHGPSKPPSVPCHVCGKCFRDRRHLRAHFERAHPRTRVLCHLCPASFKTNTYLQEHISACHEKKIAFECNICGRTFVSRSSWARHKGRHENKKFSCPHCEREFLEKTNMLRHIRVIHELGRSTKTVTCDKCKKNFTNPGNLRQHIKTVHFSEYNHKCDICGKGFIRRKNLEDHKNSHHRIRKIKTKNVAVKNLESPLHNTLHVGQTTEADFLSIVKQEIPEAQSSVVVQTTDESLQNLIVLITETEAGETASAASHIESVSNTSGIQFISQVEPIDAVSEVTIAESGSEQSSALNDQLQQILNLAELQANPNQTIHIQEVTQEMAGLFDHVQCVSGPT